MTGYTHEYSRFPSSIMEKIEFKDIDESVSAIINQIEAAIRIGDFTQAQMLIRNNNINDYIINAYKLNWIIEEIRNAQLYSKTKGQQIVYVNSISELPDNPVDGDIYRVRKG